MKGHGSHAMRRMQKQQVGRIAGKAEKTMERAARRRLLDEFAGTKGTRGDTYGSRPNPKQAERGARQAVKALERKLRLEGSLSHNNWTQLNNARAKLAAMPKESAGMKPNFRNIRPTSMAPKNLKPRTENSQNQMPSSKPAEKRPLSRREIERQRVERKQREERAFNTVMDLASGKRVLRAMRPEEITGLKNAVQRMFRERAGQNPSNAGEVVKRLGWPASWEETVKEILRS